jgi:hypothetical protein
MALRRRPDLKSVHLLVEHASLEIRNTKVTYPAIVNHIEIKVLTMKFIATFALDNEGINCSHPTN